MLALGFADLPSPSEVQTEMRLVQPTLAPPEGAAPQKGADVPFAAVARPSGTE